MSAATGQNGFPFEEPLFDIDKLSCRYGKQTVLDDLAVRLPRHQVIAVCGHSGSGKSTLLNLLGLLRGASHVTGTVRLRLHPGPPAKRTKNDPLTLYPANWGLSRRRLRAHQFGFVLQSSYLVPTLTCRHNLEMPLIIQRQRPKGRDERVSALLHEVYRLPGQDDLEEVMDRLPRQASGGQRQRVAILRALIHDPVVVFADEPCANLDPVNAESVMELLCRWQRGTLLQAGSEKGDRTLLLVSHDTESVVRHAESILVLRKGRLVENRLFRRADWPADIQDARDELKRLMRSGDISPPARPASPSQGIHPCVSRTSSD